jgi:hypothetical protein
VDFLVKRDDLSQTRMEESEPPDLKDGQALLEVDRFGFTANNVTYAVFGEAMSYWNFFPAPEGWGRVPVWGFADVAESANENLDQGTRVFGYFPMSTHLVVNADRVNERGFIDASPHRAPLPAAYNSYAATEGDPRYNERFEDQYMILIPLFFTSFLIDDFLEDGGFFGAESMVLSSASSKTAIALASLLAQRDAINVIGLTSPGNADFVEDLGFYDHAVTYDDLGSLPDGKAVYVDMSGNGEVRSAVHGHYGEDLAHSSVVGDTHWDNNEAPDGALPGPHPTFFFAPDRIVSRTADWGPDGLDDRLTAAWLPFVEASGEWLEVVRGAGPEAVERVYREVLDDQADPAIANVLSIRS